MRPRDELYETLHSLGVEEYYAKLAATPAMTGAQGAATGTSLPPRAPEHERLNYYTLVQRQRYRVFSSFSVSHPPGNFHCAITGEDAAAARATASASGARALAGADGTPTGTVPAA